MKVNIKITLLVVILHKPTNSFSITKRDLSTVNVSIPEQAYQNGAIVTVAPSVATYTDKTTGEVLKLAGDVVITSTATTQEFMM